MKNDSQVSGLHNSSVEKRTEAEWVLKRTSSIQAGTWV